MKAPPIAGRARLPPAGPLAPHGERPDDLRRELPHGPVPERPERRPPAVRPLVRWRAHPPGIPPGGRRTVRARRGPRAARGRAPRGPSGAAGPRDPREPPRDGGTRPPRRGRGVPGTGVGRPRPAPPRVPLHGPRDDLNPRPPVGGRGVLAPTGPRVRVRDDDVLLDPPRSAPRDPWRADRGPPRVRGPVRDRVLSREREPRAVREVPPGDRAGRGGVRVVAGAGRGEPPPPPRGARGVSPRGGWRACRGARGRGASSTPCRPRCGSRTPTA